MARWILAAMMAVAMCGTVSSFAEEKTAEGDKPKLKEGGCCDKTQKAGKECAHPCCVKAAEQKEVCTKCNPPAKESK
jgi:hypothetical protein